MDEYFASLRVSFTAVATNPLAADVRHETDLSVACTEETGKEIASAKPFNLESTTEWNLAYT
jgi:hypothetical protein